MFTSKTRQASRELAAQFETPFGVDLVGLMQALAQRNDAELDRQQRPSGYAVPQYPQPAAFSAN